MDPSEPSIFLCKKREMLHRLKLVTGVEISTWFPSVLVRMGNSNRASRSARAAPKTRLPLLLLNDAIPCAVLFLG